MALLLALPLLLVQIYVRRFNQPRTEEPLAVRDLLPGDDYEELQWGVQALTGIPHERAVLTNGRNLYTGRTLAEWGFFNETTLYLVPRMTPEDRAHFEREPQMEYCPTRSEVEPFRPTAFVPPPPLLPADGGLAGLACQGSAFDGSWAGDAWEVQDIHAYSVVELATAAAAVPLPAEASASVGAASAPHGSATAGVAAGSEADQFARATAALRMGCPASSLLDKLVRAQRADGRFVYRDALAAMAVAPTFMTVTAHVGVALITKAKEKLDAALHGLPMPFGGHPLVMNPPAASALLAAALLEAHCPDGEPVWSLMTDKALRPFVAPRSSAGQEQELGSAEAVQVAIDALAGALS